MSHARTQHPNAVLTPAGRRRMVDCVLVHGHSIEATAERFQVDAKTVRKWRDRWLVDGDGGLVDRSSRPRRSPAKTRRRVERKVLSLRAKRRWGADRIAHRVGLAPSTVQRILNDAGVGRLDVGDRATAAAARGPIVRYQRERPGELVHVDIKKLAGIPTGGGWRHHGRGRAPHTEKGRIGYRYIHTALDDRSRLAYSEILDNETGTTAAGFWRRARDWFAAHGITIERALTDNGACYRSHEWADALAETGVTHKRTRPYRPQTNGKVERFHRILLEEWAYIRPWPTDHQRHQAYNGFIHFYNHHRPHGALGWQPPARILRDNLPIEHS